MAKKRKTSFGDQDNRVAIEPSCAALPVPHETQILFPRNPSTARSFDFGPWYTPDIAPITRACHGAILQMLHAGQRSTSTVASYCDGLRNFLRYCREQAVLGRELTLADIDQPFIRGYLAWLARAPNTKRGGVLSENAQRTVYKFTKPVLLHLAQLGLLAPGHDLFPQNPFPGANSRVKGERAFSQAERRRLVAALKADLGAILAGDFQGSQGSAWTIMATVIALRTGMNQTPLLELGRDALHPHPIKEDHRLLVSFKRRGNATTLASLRWSQQIEEAVTAQGDAIAVYEWVRAQTEALVAQAPRNCVPGCGCTVANPAAAVIK